MFVPLVLFSINYTARILEACGIEAAVAVNAQYFIIASLPGIFIDQINIAQIRFMNCQGIPRGPAYCKSFGILLHPLWSYLLVPKYGIKGTGYAKCVTETVILTCLTIYSRCNSDVIASSFSCAQNVAEGLWRNFVFGVECTPLILLERFSGAFLMLICGLLGPEINTAFILIVQLMCIIFGFGLGAQAATTTYIGQSIGNEDVPLAQKYFWQILRLQLILVTFILAFL